VEKSSLDEQRAATHDSLVAYTPTWSDHRTRVARTGGLDNLLNEQWRIISGHMDRLLERYFSLTGGVELAVYQPEVEHVLGVE
jgi:hypothetical protein